MRRDKGLIFVSENLEQSSILKLVFRILILVICLVGFATFALAMEQASRECPNIKLIEPNRVTTSGDTVEFRLEHDLQDLKGIQVEWKVSEGTIEKGQGTLAIVVRTRISPSEIHTIVADASIKGLPNECETKYQGFAPVGAIFDPVLLDEYGKLPIGDQKGRLDNALSELLRNSTYKGLLILFSKKGTSEKQLMTRVKFLKDHIFRYRKFTKDRIIIVSDSYPSSGDAVKIYRVPSGVNALALCAGCRVHNQ